MEHLPWGRVILIVAILTALALIAGCWAWRASVNLLAGDWYAP